jgi:hypothetical protein
MNGEDFSFGLASTREVDVCKEHRGIVCAGSMCPSQFADGAGARAREKKERERERTHTHTHTRTHTHTHTHTHTQKNKPHENG